MWRRSRRLGRVVAVLVLLAGCSSGGGEEGATGRSPGSTSTSTSVSSTTTTTTEAPTTTTSAAQAAAAAARAAAPVRSAPPQPPAPSCPAVPERAAPLDVRPAYRLRVALDLGAGVVSGEQVVRFTPDRDTDRVVFRLWANSPRIARAGGGIQVVGSDPQGFEQPAPTVLERRGTYAAGVPVEVALSWRLTLPTSATNDRIARSGDAVRLGSFFPVLAWEPEVGWAMDPPTSGFAEASVSVPSDFEVDVAVPEGSGLGVLATGVSDRPGHWVASAVPDWAVSIGRFTTASATAVGGRVAVTVGVDAQVQESPEPYLRKVVASLDRFSALYGEYPWPSYSLAIQPALSGGIEYPMHVLQGPGTGGRTTSHEVAHMWFYGLVATHQGRDPWIDEGLATWAEGRFEGTTPSLMARSIPAEGRGRAGEPMTFWESRQSVYYRSVYVQGAQAVGALGPADVVDCALRHLVARQAYRVTDNAELIAAVSAVVPSARDVLARFGIRG